jgi:hypothetical protein
MSSSSQALPGKRAAATIRAAAGSVRSASRQHNHSCAAGRRHSAGKAAIDGRLVVGVSSLGQWRWGLAGFPPGREE